MLLSALFFTGYLAVGNCVFGYVAAMRGESNKPWERPEPFCAGLFWPFIILLILGAIPKNIGTSIGLRKLAAVNKRAEDVRRCKEISARLEQEEQEAMAELDK